MSLIVVVVVVMVVVVIVLVVVVIMVVVVGTEVVVVETKIIYCNVINSRSQVFASWFYLISISEGFMCVLPFLNWN